ncbi:MAG TPA: sigma-70 family RNA polymerase sigma factor [Spirochaetes bacterium]|nr:sigma-70 family RNA polymerase sigma factor [Spirochaetota bacterium]
MEFFLTERTNDQWVSELAESSPKFNLALEDLRFLLLKGLSAGLRKWRGVNKEILEDAAQEALVKIISRLDTFRGNCRFTTWALKIGVNTALSELRHRRWSDVSLDELTESKGMGFMTESMSSRSYSPEKQTIQNMIMDTLKRLMETELTERQRKAMIAVRFHGMPLAEVARQMGSNQNSLYKLLHDARLRLKNAMSKENLSANEVIASFSGS